MKIRGRVLGTFDDELGEHTILPLGCLWINETVKLVHSNRLGIKAVNVNLSEVVLSSKSAHSML